MMTNEIELKLISNRLIDKYKKQTKNLYFDLITDVKNH